MSLKYIAPLGLLLPLTAFSQGSAPGGAVGQLDPEPIQIGLPVAPATEASPGSSGSGSPSASSSSPAIQSLSGGAGYVNEITFDEITPGTPVPNTYQHLGIIFGGSGPKVVDDVSAPGGHVLSGEPTLEGDITGSFVLQGTATPAPVYRMGFVLGSIEGVNSVLIEFFGDSGQLIYSQYASSGFRHYSFTGGNIGIYSWRASIVGTEDAGFGIDNVYFSVPGETDDEDREKGESQTCDGNPVNPAVGNKYQMETDYEGARPFPLSVTRAYNSLDGSWQFFPEIKYNPGDVATQIVRASGKGLTYLGITGHPFMAPSSGDITGDLTRNYGTGGIVGWQYDTLDDMTEQYDVAGRLVSITNRAGISHTYTYNVDNITVTHSLGGSIVYDIDLNGRITGFTDPAGETYSYSYDANGMITGVTYPGATGGRVYHYENATHPDLLTGISDANGDRFATWAYDSNRRAISSTHNGGADLTTFDYSQINFVNPRVTITNPLGKDTTHLYIVANGVRKIWRTDGLASANCVASFQQYGYDGSLFINSVQDWEGNVTQYVRDSDGRELTRTEAAGTPQERVIQTTWHPTFNVPAEVIEPGKTTTYTYDGSGNLLSTSIVDTTGP